MSGYDNCCQPYYCFPAKKEKEGCTIENICQTNKAKVEQYAVIEQEVEQTNHFVAVCRDKDVYKTGKHGKHGGCAD